MDTATAVRSAAMVEWASKRLVPSFFVTLTWRPPEHPTLEGRHSRDYCKRSADALFKVWSRELGSSRAQVERGEGLFGLLAWERHASGSWHAHGVLVHPTAEPTRENCLHMKELAYTRTGISRVFQALDEGALRYCLKYALKEADTWDIVGLWRARSPRCPGPARAEPTAGRQPESPFVGEPDERESVAVPSEVRPGSMAEPLPIDDDPPHEPCTGPDLFGCSICWTNRMLEEAHDDGKHDRKRHSRCRACRDSATAR